MHLALASQAAGSSSAAAEQRQDGTTGSGGFGDGKRTVGLGSAWGLGRQSRSHRHTRWWRGRTAGEGAAAAMEFGCGGYGGHALANAQARGQSERGDGKAREEARAARLSLQEGAGDATGRQDTRQRSSAMVGALSVHGGHAVINSNTWRASLCPTWSPFFA